MSDDYTPKKYKKENYDSKRADECVKYCKTCKVCWETIKISKGKLYTAYYGNYPTYGKIREMCERCKQDLGAHEY